MSAHPGGHPDEKTRKEEPRKVETTTESPFKIEIGGTPAPLTRPPPERELVPVGR